MEEKAPQVSEPLVSGGVVTLRVDDDLSFFADKALLGALSGVLKEAFQIEPGCLSVKVEGTTEAWRFISSYPLMTNKGRLAALQPNATHSAKLLAEVLGVAMRYDMPVLVHEVEDYAHAWTNFQPGMASEQHLECPQNPMWWINLAEKHNRIDLAGAALSALVRRSTHVASTADVIAWTQARARVLSYGQRQGGSMLWQLVCRVLDGCDK